MKRTRRIWGWALLLAPLFLALGFTVWASLAADPLPEAERAMVGDALVEVTSDRWLVFRPNTSSREVGLILYPGGRVDPAAYAPAARAIAEKGYLVVIVPMPLNLAVMAPDRAAKVLTSFQEVQTWAIGGHSLGGSMAARFARANPDHVDGLVLWASYPAAGDDLWLQSMPVASIYGTLDGLATGDEIASSRALLPAATRWTAIEGGNHAQFGYYGPQSGDRQAAISREDQQSQIVEATLALLADLG